MLFTTVFASVDGDHSTANGWNADSTAGEN